MTDVYAEMMDRRLTADNLDLSNITPQEPTPPMFQGMALTSETTADGQPVVQEDRTQQLSAIGYPRPDVVRQALPPKNLIYVKGYNEAARRLYGWLEGPDAEVLDDDQLNAYMNNEMSSFNNNLAGYQGTAWTAMSLFATADAQTRKDFITVLNAYDTTQTTGSQVGRAIRHMIADPSTYVGLGTLGSGFLARQGAKGALKQALEFAAKNPKAMMAIEGALYSGGFDALRQFTEIMADETMPVADRVMRFGVSAGIGATLAPLLGTAVSDVAGAVAPALGRGADTASQFISEQGQAAQQRLSERGTRMMSGIDPTQVADEAIALAGKAVDTVTGQPVKTSTEEMSNILNIRSEQMAKPEAERIQPSGENPLFNTSAEAYNTKAPRQEETPVPRAPEGVKLPKKNRAAPIIDNMEATAQRLAQRMRPYLGTPAQFFYNTEPIIAKAVELGISEDVAREQLRKFALNYAATSPRTTTAQNLRNASLVSAKETAGIPIDKVIGPGGEGINEKGYPMMIGPSGIHRLLVDAKNAEGISFDTNPKPATFAENVAGNLQGVTVDTHAIRGALDAMNEAVPGSIPEGWIKKKDKQGRAVDYWEQYQKDPTSFDPAKMVDDTLASQKIDGKSMQTEYAVFSDLYKRAAEILNVTPAEAQSLGWFGSGDRTGLASDLKTIVDLIDDRVDVTAQATGKTKDDVFKMFMSGQIPLLSFGGMTLIERTLRSEGENDGNT